MSAFVVSKAHIDALVTAGLVRNCGSNLRWFVPAPVNPEAFARGEVTGPAAYEEYKERSRSLVQETAGRVGAMLWAENERSVNHRYDEDDIEEPYVFARYTKFLSAVTVLKLIACYEYQSCEHPEWDNSEARAFCDSLRKWTINRLEGYDDAPWGL